MSRTIYKVIFINRDEAYEIYAKKIYQADMMGFIAIEDVHFSNDAVIVDPSEERMKHEFRNVKRFFVPIHSVIRIDEVEKAGPAKITEISDKVARLHPSLYPEKDSSKAT